MKAVSFFHSDSIFKNSSTIRTFWKHADKHEVKKHDHFSIEVILFFIFLAICGCLNVLDGPFNQNGTMVPSLLYANNDSSYVTFWDEELKTYRTYDQDKNYFLAEPLFEIEDIEQVDGRMKHLKIAGTSKGVEISGTSIVPTTQLSEAGMQIQREKGCTACHVK